MSRGGAWGDRNGNQRSSSTTVDSGPRPPRARVVVGVDELLELPAKLGQPPIGLEPITCGRMKPQA